jgi:hypothetical protein
MKRYSIEEVCEQLGISRQGMNVRCRKYGIEKIKEGRRSYLTTQQIKILKGSKSSKTPENDDTETSGGSQTGDERLITRLTDENDYLRKKLDEESEKVKGSLNVIFQQTERIGKLEMENNKLLPYAPIEHHGVENETETERKRKDTPIEVITERKKKPWWDWWIKHQGE